MAKTVCDLAATCAIFPSIPSGSSDGSLSFCAAVFRRRCTVDTSARLLTAPFSHSPTLPLILEGATGGCGGGEGGGGEGGGGEGGGGEDGGGEDGGGEDGGGEDGGGEDGGEGGGAPFSHAVITLASVFT